MQGLLHKDQDYVQFDCAPCVRDTDRVELLNKEGNFISHNNTQECK